MKYLRTILILLAVATLPLAVFAFENNAPAAVELNVPLPTGGGASLYSVAGIGPYFQVLFTFVFGILFTASIISIIWAGIRWITSAGDASVIKEQQHNIINGIMGFAVALFSYYILYIINPDLTTFKGLNVNPVTGYRAGCDWTTNPECPYEKAPDEGKECDDKSQCVSGLCLDSLDGIMDDKGKCAAAVQVGETCEDNIVVQNGMNPDAPCPASTRCKGTDRLGEEHGKCYPTALGSPCWDKSECDSGLCWDLADNSEDGVGKCSAPLQGLQKCADTNVVSAGDDDDMPCAEGLRCNTDLIGPAETRGTCQLWGYDGWSCSKDIDCQTADGYVCNKGFTPDQCKKRQPEGQPCDTDLACQPGLVCGGLVFGTCEQP